MRNPTEVTVESAIVHLIRRADPYYSQAELDLVGQDRVREFLGAHIRNSLIHERAQSATFLRDANDAEVFRCARSLLADGGTLVEKSPAIAQHLHKAITVEGRASESAIAISMYSVANEPTDARFLAILKLEPGGAFRPEPGKKGGKKIVTLAELNDVLPTEREQLQKAALIRTPGVHKPAKGSFDLMVLDRQKRDGGEPAGYFMEFLRAQLALDAHATTWALHHKVHLAVNKLEEEDRLSLVERETVLSTLRGALGSQSVKSADLIDNLSINDAAKDFLRQEVQAVIPDGSFRPDPDVVAKITKVRRFQGDDGLKVTIDAAASADQHLFNAKVANGYTVVTIRTRIWREVTR